MLNLVCASLHSLFPVSLAAGCGAEDDVSWCADYVGREGPEVCTSDQSVADNCCYACRNAQGGTPDNGNLHTRSVHFS